MDIFMGFLMGILVVVLVAVVYAAIATFREYLEDIRLNASHANSLAIDVLHRVIVLEKEADDERNQDS
jgi:hypothetical protein